MSEIILAMNILAMYYEESMTIEQIYLLLSNVTTIVYIEQIIEKSKHIDNYISTLIGNYILC